MTYKKPYIIAITGASAQPIAERSIQLLLRNNENLIVILSKGAYKVWSSEMNIKIPIDMTLQEQFWRDRLNESKGSLQCLKWDDHSAGPASGSFKTKAMVIVPCTMGTVGRLASG